MSADFSEWRSFTGYFELHRAVQEAGPLSSDAFVQGPLHRFLELALDRSKSRGERARIMEFARQNHHLHQRSLALDEADSKIMHASVRAKLEALIPADGEDSWLLEIWEGRRGHHCV